jgi:dolichyl-phosphate beta-glucosyltransferase
LEYRDLSHIILRMVLSIIIPVYKEKDKISADIKASAAFLKDNDLSGEIIVVDDCSRDDTAKAAEEAGGQLPAQISLKVISNDKHCGKGYAIRCGMEQTEGEYVMFADSGCCVPYEYISAGLELINSGSCEIAHASRKLKGTKILKSQHIYRRICSRLFHWFIIHFMGVPGEFTDTQCGFKIYRGDVGRNLYNQCITDGFMFDIEIILRAQKKGHRIKEFPIQWSCDFDTRLSPTRNLWRVLSELLDIKRTV